MAVSVRFNLDPIKVKAEKEVLTKIAESFKDLGKLVDLNYFEIKTERHLLTHPEYYIPFEFQQKMRPFVTNITLITDNNSYYGMKGARPHDSSYRFDLSVRISAQIGSSRISYEDEKIMIVGKNLAIMIKAYFLYCKHDGTMPDYQKMQREQKENEFQNKYKEALSTIAELEQKLKSVPKKKIGSFSFLKRS